MPEPTDYDRMLWEALNEDIAHPLTAEVPVTSSGVVLPPLTPGEPFKPQVAEYAPPTAGMPVVETAPTAEPEPEPEPPPIESVSPKLEPIQIEDEPVVQAPTVQAPEVQATPVDFNKILREPQTSSIVIDRERFPTGAIDLPPIEDVLRANTGATKLPWVKATVPATGVDGREADGTGPIDIVKPVSAAVAGATIKTGTRRRTKRQTTLAFVTAGLMILVGGLFLAAYFLGYLR